MPSLYKITKFVVVINTIDQNKKQYNFQKQIFPSDLTLGTTTSRYPFLLHNLNDYVHINVLYNYTPSTESWYYYDLSTLMDLTSTIQLQNTKSVLAFRLFTFYKLGGVEYSEMGGCGELQVDSSSGYLEFFLRKGSFILN